MEDTFKSKDKVICQICQRQFGKNYNIRLNNLNRHLKSVHLEFLNSRSKIYFSFLKKSIKKYC